MITRPRYAVCETFGVLVLCLVALGGCGGPLPESNSQNGQSGDATPGGGATPGVIVRVTDPNDAAYKAQVELPGNLASAEPVTIHADPNAPALPSDVALAGTVIELGPHGATFAQPVKISLPFDPTTHSNPDTLLPFWYNETSGEWEVPTSLFTIDMASGTMQVIMTHFCRMCVGDASPDALPPSGDSGFRVNEHGFSIANFATGSFGGVCNGMAVFADWYFEATKGSGCSLHNIAIATQMEIAAQAQDILPMVHHAPGSYPNAMTVIKRHLATKKTPTFLWLYKDGRPYHAVLAIRYAAGVIYFYDSNHPDAERTGTDIALQYADCDVEVLGRGDIYPGGADALLREIRTAHCAELSDHCQADVAADINLSFDWIVYGPQSRDLPFTVSIALQGTRRELPRAGSEAGTVVGRQIITWSHTQVNTSSTDPLAKMWAQGISLSLPSLWVHEINVLDSGSVWRAYDGSNSTEATFAYQFDDTGRLLLMNQFVGPYMLSSAPGCSVTLASPPITFAVGGTAQQMADTICSQGAQAAGMRISESLADGELHPVSQPCTTAAGSP